MSYKIGDVIKKYTVTRDFDSANGGQCQWGFAEYNGEEFFIKKFLTPIYPTEKSPGSEKGKQKKREKCLDFERKQTALIKALSACGNGGLVVRTIEIFKHGDDNGEHYFKVSQKVDTSSLSDKVHTLDTKKKLFVMLTAAGALKILHQNGIIHLDLKPDNILIQELSNGKLVAKIIDFDSSLIEGESTDTETLVGDTVYYSPELAQYIATRGKTTAPTKQSDIFALGLIFCRYWTGKMPNFSPSYNYAYEAVLKGEKLTLPDSDKDTTLETQTSRLKGTLIKPRVTNSTLDSNTSAVKQIINKMLLPNPKERLSIKEVHEQLKSLYNNGVLSTVTTEIEIPRPTARLTISKTLKS
jgi:serine/threonine protein kinase